MSDSLLNFTMNIRLLLVHKNEIWEVFDAIAQTVYTGPWSVRLWLSEPDHPWHSSQVPPKSKNSQWQMLHQSEHATREFLAWLLITNKQKKILVYLTYLLLLSIQTRSDSWSRTDYSMLWAFQMSSLSLAVHMNPEAVMIIYRWREGIMKMSLMHVFVLHVSM